MLEKCDRCKSFWSRFDYKKTIENRNLCVSCIRNERIKILENLQKDLAIIKEILEK